MKTWTIILCLVVGVRADEPSWPAWRGPLATGVSPTAKPPLEWGETKNVQWKVAAPGSGHGSPVIASRRVFIVAASPVGKGREPVYDNAPGSHDNTGVTHEHEFHVTALDLDSGRTLWRTVAARTFPHEGGHVTGSLASGSPVTDGTHVWAFFGSRGLFCLRCDDGGLVWKRDLGQLTTHHAHGEGASPALHDGVLVVPWDQETGSKLLALDAATGKEMWSASRDEITTWCTPVIARPSPAEPPQVIVSATKRIRGYDLKTGRVIWECGGMSRNVIATPVVADGIVCCGCSYDSRAMMAIRLAGSAGDITDTSQVLWSTNQRTPYVPSPLLFDERLYFLGHYQGLLSCRDFRSGTIIAPPTRLEGINDVYASPVGADGRVYITDRNGDTVVIAHDGSRTLTQLAQNHLDDRFSASAALVGRSLILRGEKWVYCLRESE